MSLRQYRLDEAFDATKCVAHLRRPQREAFKIVHELVANLVGDIPQLSHAAMEEGLRELGYKSTYPPHFQIQLATGVGKTRLMGSIAYYLFHARQTKNILILAPRVAILEKLEREASPTSAKYLLIDPSLAPRVNLCTRGNIEAFHANPSHLNLFLLSPQTLAGDAGRFSRPDEYRGYSLREYLSNCDDLVVFADEAHHLRAAEEAAWSSAIRDLKPKLWLGFTATPQTDSGETLYRYELAECLRDGLYTKSVKIWVEKKPEEMSDDEWDRTTVDFALKRLARKKAAIEAFRLKTPDFPAIEPVLLVCAKDTSHADEIGRLLKDRFGLRDEEILVTHSDKKPSEQDVARLISIDSPGSLIRAVVNVFQLTEGWDVTNVYVIAPLRAMATFVGAVQSMGRGLRLPAGKRTGDADVDSLDVVCFGRAVLGDIVRDATREFGGGSPPVEVSSAEGTLGENSVADSRVRVNPARRVTLPIHRLEKVLATPSLDFEVEANAILRDNGVSGVSLEDLQTSTTNDVAAVGFESITNATTIRILSKCKSLDPIGDASSVRRLVERFLRTLGATENDQIRLDPVRLAVFLAAEIHKRYTAQSPDYRSTNSRDEIEFDSYEWPVPTGREVFLPRMKPGEWTKRAHFRLPIESWKKSVYEAVAFESAGEYKVACILDDDADVLWWLRNDPPELRIPTPIGHFEPDFVVASGTGKRVTQLTALEVKGGYLWDGPGSTARLKAMAAVNWATALSKLGDGPPWSIAVILDTDVDGAASFGQLLRLNLL